MDLDGPQLISNILSSEELEQTPPGVQEKLKTWIEEFFDEYCKNKAAANRLHDYEQKLEELQATVQDYELKLESQNKNVEELRSQLDSVSSERVQLLEQCRNHEMDMVALRSERNSVAEERDSLLKLIERQKSELDRLQEEIHSYQQQLKNAITSKCEAIARVDEIESQKVALDFKERRMEQERTMLHNQIRTLTDDLNRNIAELQSIRRDNTMQGMHLEARLAEKTEELKIVQTQCTQYKETIDRLTQNIQDLSTKLLNQNEEANKMMDFYKKELEAKTKLAELYKSNCEDTDVERNELSTAITDLKRMLAEASEQYGELETKFKATLLQHEQELEERGKVIESQKSELKHANDLLKEVQNETMESAISKIAPSAAIASRLIRTDMSLTELYSLYVKSSEELDLQKRENARLNLQFKTILQELSENAPVIKKQELEYEKLIETNNILAHQRDELLSKKVDMEELMGNAHSKINHLERENKKLKNSQNDLSRQVCYLLKEVEQLRIGLLSDKGAVQSGNLSTTDDVISKKLVTFTNIVELQENNQKLLLLVRDLSTKLEDAETLKQQMDAAAYQEKIENYAKKFQSMQETLNQQNNTVATLVSKCERYKKMYFELQKNLQKSGAHSELSDIEDTEMGEIDDTENKNMTNISQSKNRKSMDANAERRIRDLEQQLQEVKDQYKTLKEQYEYYTQEKKNNERIMNEQFDSMRTEVRELTSTNCKLMSSLEYNKEQLKLQQKNISTYKQQITALEDRSKNYENTIIKHEQTVHFLKDEVMKAQHGHSAAQSEASHLRSENRILKDTVNRLQAEKEGYHRDQQNQNLLLNNLEMIKSNLERSEMEGRARLEQRLDETVRELSAQRRRFQEEEDRFRETTSDLKRQAESAKKCMEEERGQSEKLRKELQALREELTNKTNQIDELSKKLQESLTPSKNDNPIALANKKTREFEVKLEEAKIEINSLSNELAKAREHSDQYFKMSQSAEAEIKSLHEVHTTYTEKTESQINELKSIELNLKSRISELEAEVQLASMTEVPNSNQSDQLKKSKEELKDVLQKLSECNRNLRALRTENTSLSESLNAVQGKYANEMILHSADIQELTRVKEEMTKIQDQMNALITARDCAKDLYEELKGSHDESLRLLQNEKDEMEKRIVDLNGLNSSLHDQIEALTMKLSILSQTQPTNVSSNSLNETAMDTSGTELNRSRLEDDPKNNDQLLQIIKYLRKEKDLIDAKLDILKAENARLQSENMILQKKLDELKGSLNQERAKSETLVVSATKHEEILRKIENLNAITDSNRILREERNSLAARVKELNEHINAIENDLLPLQNQNRELSTKIEELTSENTSLRTEAIKWRQRANVLVEKSNKNPEEFKRLQTERENLAKMLTHEKELMKQTTDELNAIKTEKLQRETEIASLEKQIQTLTEEKKKVSDDYAGVRQNNVRMLQEIMELRNKLLQKEESLQKLTEEMESKEAQLQDSKNKEFQIRKIAKRYKDSYLELSNKTAAASTDGAATAQDNMDLGGNSGAESAVGTAAAATAVTNELEQQRNTIENLNGVIRTMQEESEKLRKDYDDLKAAVEIDDRTKTLLREAKARIVSLTESKNAISQELNTTKSKLQNVLQTSENADATINSIKTQYEETLSRLEKELLEQNNQNKEAIVRLSRENESLLMRINQLNRQLGQQSAKPSTSSVAITDKGSISESSPRTANVKPMSGSTTVQQSATVTPWRGSETPLASIRPISVQNSRTAAILPTSQQPAAGGSSTSTSTSSSSTTTVSTGCSNTALVPPQQQVHTTGSSSIESMSSSPTSSHTDYMPSTSSSASVAVAAIPPMGSTSAAESSQEAESVQQPQQNESQLLVGGGQPQVVALVSPRVEGSSQNVPSPNLQLQQDPGNQQPSTSGTTSSSTHIAVSSHSRHTPSSSNVTTSQAGTSGGHKRPRELEGDSSTNVEDSTADKALKHPKRLRGSEPAMLGVTESGIDVEYQVPTSSQRDQEDDIVVVDSEEEDDGMIEADDGPTDGDAEHEGYEDSYEQDQDMDENDIPEVNESNIGVDAEIDNNEVDVDEGTENQAHCTSGTDNQSDVHYNTGASTSHAAAASMAHSHDMDSHQQSQTISSGSYESNPNATQPATQQWKQTRPQKPTAMLQHQGLTGNVSESGEQDPSGSRPSDSGAELVSSPQGSKFGISETGTHSEQHESKMTTNEATEENGAEGEELVGDRSDENVPVASKSGGSSDAVLAAEEDMDNVEEDFAEDAAAIEVSENADSESHNSSGATQSEIQDIQQNQVEATSEDNEGADGVSSEGEKQAVEEIEEEGREAEASTSPSITTRSKAIKSTGNVRRPHRGFHRGGRPTPIIWQDGAGHSRNVSPNHRGQEPPGSPLRGFPNQRSQRARRMRRPTGGNYGNMRYS
ncbi:PREDICTED: nucleoprotein TPR isoform X2 [Rhagoletis zephyria]|uniref:nucleoprotein TPR isoform X2 n=1 Tax=Rhagoletis zephyria TaxID=28612 RepID=UPI000811223E|nr:PREDICTED: nucleoprotein TPR isoform X2 [Rhagoletis zephyria]